MKKILFLVRSSKPYGTQRLDLDYIINELKNNFCEIDIYDPHQKLLMNVNNKKTTEYNFLPRFLFKTPFYFLFNILVFIKFCFKNKNKYDYVTLCYVRNEYLLFPNLTKNLGKKLVLVLYGSDINDKNLIKKIFKKLFKYSYKIITTNPVFLKNFIEKNNKKELEKKSISIMLPQPQFELYKNFTFESKFEFKLKLNLPLNKTVILVGTNSNQNEQHELIINELMKLDNFNNYHFIFPLTNVFNKINKREMILENHIHRKFTNQNYTIIKGFISYEQMRDYRFASDIFINLRKSDQLAASMLESGLAYCEIITGKWLPYNDFTTKIECHVIDNFSNLVGLISELPKRTNNLKNNHDKILSFFNDALIKNWVEIFE
jgi:hypothetical protein